MAKEDNLIPFRKDDARTKEIARMGGIARAEKGRKERNKIQTFKEMLNVLLSEVDEYGYTLREHITGSMIKKAQQGSVDAFKVIRDTSGEVPTASIEIKDVTEPFKVCTQEQLDRILEIGNQCFDDDE